VEAASAIAVEITRERKNEQLQQETGKTEDVGAKNETE
jgi:hypothetical protein